METPVPGNSPQNADGPELLWSGTDQSTAAAINTALAKAGIPYHIQMRGPEFRPGVSQPTHAIFIPSSHHDAAQAVLKSLRLD
jgi:hypothetical protein